MKIRRRMLKSKIHRARVTDADLHYQGSITIDRDLMDAADMVPYEQVAVLDIEQAKRALLGRTREILNLPTSFHPHMVARGGGARDIELFVAPPELCTDNAAMLGPIAEHYLSKREPNRFCGARIRARSNAELDV
jgi:hypothetical protein